MQWNYLICVCPVASRLATPLVIALQSVGRYLVGSSPARAARKKTLLILVSSTRDDTPEALPRRRRTQLKSSGVAPAGNGPRLASHRQLENHIFRKAVTILTRKKVSGSHPPPSSSDINASHPPPRVHHSLPNRRRNRLFRARPLHGPDGENSTPFLTA